MKRSLIFLLLLVTKLAFAQTSKINSYTVIPLPNSISLTKGSPFVLSNKTTITYTKENLELKRIAYFLSEYIAISTGIKMTVDANSKSKNTIRLESNYVSDHKEAYELKVTSESITLNGASEAGVFYAVQTLRKTLPTTPNTTTVILPTAVILDYPRFEYRGMMLDVARHFAPVSFVKKFIDILALHNINTFHWHLTDDQGWRVEIKKYPNLTTIGSNRKETLIGKNSGKYDGKPHGGFYTQEEIKDIVKYASQRYITIIPEIDLPGHMLAALASYPELGCTGGPYQVLTKWGVSDDVLCVGNENTFRFLEGVFDELITLFPSNYYHIGGDECPKVRWKICPKCQAKIVELGLIKDKHHSAEEKLQSYCINRMEKYLNSNGKQIIGWDEILEGGIAPNATIMSWKSFEAGIQAAKLGHKVIMTPSSHVYFDHYQGRDTKLEPLAIGGYSDVEKVYNFDPIPKELTAQEQKFIIGGQANIWREYMPTTEQVEYMILPRIAALSESLWTEPAQKNYSTFLPRLASFFSVYDKLNYNYAKHILEVSASSRIDTDKSILFLELKNPTNSPIYYTIDGSIPNFKSIKYTNPIEIKETVTAKAIVVRGNKTSRILERNFEFNKASLKPITLLNQPVEKYTFDGAATLIDGKRGKSGYSTGDYIGFYGKDLEAIIDLKTIQTISEVILGTYIDPNSWIFGAKSYQVLTSDDGQNFTEVFASNVAVPVKNEGASYVDLTAKFTPRNTRFVKIIAKIADIIPDWHYATGQPTYLFADEIIIH